MSNPSVKIKRRLQHHLNSIADFRSVVNVNLYGRKRYTDHYYKGQKYIEELLIEMGIPYRLEPVFDKKTYYNIVTTSNHPLIILTAHYDCAYFCAGSDDNASSIAIILELLRRLPNKDRDYVQVVFFTLEEGSYERIAYQKESWDIISKKILSDEDEKKLEMELENLIKKTKEKNWVDVLDYALIGSQQFVKDHYSWLRKEQPFIINLESVGYFSHEKNSQKKTINGYLPTTADFIGLLSRKQNSSMTRVFEEASTVLISPIDNYGSLPIITIPQEKFPEETLFQRADHYPFWVNNLDAVTLVDTIEYRYLHYHMPTDTPEKLDYDSMTKLLFLLEEVIKKIITNGN